MMSKKQWFVVLCIFIVYLLLGAAIFHIIESDEERERNLIDLRLRDDLSGNIYSQNLYPRD